MRYAGASLVLAAILVGAARGGPAEMRRHALTHPGDAARGKDLFFNARLTQCSTCHRVNGQGTDVGPDLSHVGGKFDRVHLIESVLEPSRQIVEGYRTTSIVTTDGRLWTGIVRDETGDALTLVEAS